MSSCSSEGLPPFPGRAHHPAVLGREGLRPKCASVRADFQAREQAAREVCRARGVRGRVQIRPPRQQLHEPRDINPRDPVTAHLQGTVSISKGWCDNISSVLFLRC